MPDKEQLTIENVPCSVLAPEINGGRVKLNVDPGSAGAQIVMMHMNEDQMHFFRKGRRYNIVITEAE